MDDQFDDNLSIKGNANFFQNIFKKFKKVSAFFVMSWISAEEFFRRD